MPTATHKTNFAKINSDKTVFVRTLSFPSGTPYTGMEIHVAYQCDNDLVIVGKSLNKAKFIQHNEGWTELELNWHFHIEEVVNPTSFDFSLCNEGKIKPANVKFEVQFDFINQPELIDEEED